MESTPTHAHEEETLVAPGEIRELVARLTEQSVEATPAHESRTLEGLAIETGLPIARLRETLAEMRRKRPAVPPAAWAGFVVLAAVAGWALRPTPPPTLVVQPGPPVAAPPVVQDRGDLSGTVPLTSVTYGPDGGSVLVVPDFAPSVALPDGLSVSAMVGEVLWGSGDHRAAVLQKPLAPAQEKALRDVAAELLRHVRAEAARRRLPHPLQPSAFPISLSASTYSGTASVLVNLPLPGEERDAAAERAVATGVERFVRQLQDTLRQQARWRRERGP